MTPRSFLGRVWLKVSSIAPILVAAFALFFLAGLALWLVTPWLPVSWQETLTLLGEGEWVEARDKLREILEAPGLPIEIPFVALQTLQVIVAPIPGQVTGAIGGYLFGFWYGLTLTMLGLTIGSWIAMLLGRLMGVQVVRRFVPADTMAKLDELIARGGVWNFFVIYLLPGLPDDAVCFVAGLTRLSLWRLMAVMFVGRLPGMAVLTFVGTSAGEGWNAGWIVFAAAMVVSFFLWLYSDEFETWILGGPKCDPPVHEPPSVQ
jgi:uncharacterized membrane protein YdjX (TVP38/TMEM64 family)